MRENGEPASEGARQRRIDKVREGSHYDDWPTVRLSIWGVHTCTGQLINRYAIITSAHCFDGNSGSYNISVDFGKDFENDPPNGNWCISNNSPNCGVPAPANNFVVYV